MALCAPARRRLHRSKAAQWCGLVPSPRRIPLGSMDGGRVDRRCAGGHRRVAHGQGIAAHPARRPPFHAARRAVSLAQRVVRRRRCAFVGAINIALCVVSDARDGAAAATVRTGLSARTLSDNAPAASARTARSRMAPRLPRVGPGADAAQPDVTLPGRRGTPTRFLFESR